MNAAQALAFVRGHGVVLASARGPLPNLVEAIAGEPIRGSWWGHRDSHRIYRVLDAVCDSPDVLVCRLVAGKVTLVHRRLWPALVRLAARLPARGLAAVRQEHTARGSHRAIETPFPLWVPRPVLAAAKRLDERQAVSALGTDLIALLGSTPRERSGRKRRPPVR